jgi:hypothetical protein
MQIVHGGGNVSNRYRPILLRGDSHVTGDSRVTTGVTKSTERGASRGLRTSKEPLTNLLLDASHQGGTFDEEPVGESPKAKLFRKGRTLLVSLGVSEKQSGAVIGRWLKQKNDPEGILAALQYAADNAIIEPISYVTACLAKEFSNAKISLADRAKQLADQAREIERANGLGGEIVAFGGFQRG